MRAILLAAGLGTRLRPFTETTPKCLIEIGGKPLVISWLEKLTDSGIREILINTHYLSGQVEGYLRNSVFAKALTFAYEPELLGTAGTLIKNTDFIDDQDCLLIHADNYMTSSLGPLLDAHSNRPVYCLMTMLTFRTDNPKSCGIVEIDERSVVQRFYEKVDSYHGTLANGAVYALSNELIRTLVNEKDFSKDVIPSQLGKIFSIETNGYFDDIGTPDSLRKAQSFAETK
jgi:mannose-1-phosphate guanylyltransferase